jgi:hypothetical protein
MDVLMITRTKLKDPINYRRLIDKYTVQSIPTPISWKVLDVEKAESYGISELTCGNNHYLAIETVKIPEDKSALDFLQQLVEEGVLAKK